jgi:hypothetical protein
MRKFFDEIIGILFIFCSFFVVTYTLDSIYLDYFYDNYKKELIYKCEEGFNLKSAQIDFQLESYVNDFLILSSYYEIDLSNLNNLKYIDKADLVHTQKGVYKRMPCGISYIHINKDILTDPTLTMFVMWHEIGHAFGLSHDDTHFCIMNSDLSYYNTKNKTEILNSFAFLKYSMLMKLKNKDF